MTWHALIVWYRLLCQTLSKWSVSLRLISNQSVGLSLTDYGPCKIVDWLCNWPVQCSVTSPQYFTWACYLENWLTETWKEWCKAGTLLFIDVAAQFRNLLWLTENESTGNDYFAQSVSNRSAQPTELSQSQHICCMAHHSTLGDQHTQNINCKVTKFNTVLFYTQWSMDPN